MSLEGENFFGTYNDFVEENLVEDVPRKATKQERLEMLEFIGGFEKWSELDEDSQHHVLSFLDFWTRCNLSLCSKKDNAMVKNALLKVSEVKGKRIKTKRLEGTDEMKNITNVTMNKNYVELLTPTGFKRSWRLNQKENECTVVSKTKLENSVCFTQVLKLKDRNRDVQKGKIGGKVLEKSKNQLEKLTIWGDWTIDENIPDNFPNLKVFDVEYKTEEQMRFWLNRISPPLNHIDIFRDYAPTLTPFEHFSFPAVLNAKSILLTVRITISDEQFLNLTANKIVLFANSLKTETFVEMIRRWVDGELSENFSYCVVFSQELDRKGIKEGMINGEMEFRQELDYRNHRSPRNEFYRKFYRFGNPGEFYQVRSKHDYFKTASIIVTSDAFLIVHTGFSIVRDGFPTTEYKVPYVKVSRNPPIYWDY